MGVAHLGWEGHPGLVRHTCPPGAQLAETDFSVQGKTSPYFLLGLQGTEEPREGLTKETAAISQLVAVGGVGEEGVYYNTDGC